MKEVREQQQQQGLYRPEFEHCQPLELSTSTACLAT